MMAGTGIDLTTLSESAFREFVDSFDSILCDLDFTIWNRYLPPSEQMIPGVLEVLTKLAELGKKVIFVTNSSHATRETYRKELEKFEVSRISSKIMFPMAAVGQHLTEAGFKGRVHVVGDDVHRDELRSWGLQVDDEVQYPRAKYSYMGIASHLKKDPDVQAVIVDFDPNLNYLKLMEANVLLQNPECQFFTTATEKILPPIKNIRFFAVGYFSDMLEEAASKKPVRVGKPLSFMGDLLVESEHLDRSRTLVVGDSLEQDVGLGISVGMRTLWVPGEHKQVPNSEYPPTYRAPTLGHLLPLMKSL